MDGNKNSENGAMKEAYVAPTISQQVSEDRKPRKGYEPILEVLFPEHLKKPNIYEELHYDNEGLRFVTFAITARQLSRTISRHIEADLEISLRVPLSGKERIVHAVVIDGTGGLGGDAIAFGKNIAFSKVYTIELDAVRFQCLKHNISVYNLSHRVECIQGNAVNWLPLKIQNLLKKGELKREREKIISSIEKEKERQQKGQFDKVDNIEGKDSTEQSSSPVFLCVNLDPPWGGDDYNSVDLITDLWLYDETMSKVSIFDFVKQLMDAGVHYVILKLPRNFDCSPFNNNEWEVIHLNLHKKIEHLCIKNRKTINELKQSLSPEKSPFISSKIQKLPERDNGNSQKKQTNHPQHWNYSRDSNSWNQSRGQPQHWNSPREKEYSHYTRNNQQWNPSNQRGRNYSRYQRNWNQPREQGPRWKPQYNWNNRERASSYDSSNNSYETSSEQYDPNYSNRYHTNRY